MSHDSSTPDRADKADADDLDIPTFDPADHPTDPYKKVGRAAPQEIPPRAVVEGKAQPDEPVLPAAEGGSADDKGDKKKEDRSAPLLSDAPTTLAAPKIEAEAKKEDRDTAEAPSASVITEDAPAVAPAYAGAAAPVVAQEEEREPAEARRGTLDLGLLLVRLGLGGWLIVQSLSAFFHLGGSAGLSGLEEQYAPYAASHALAVGIPAAGLAAGVFVLLGLITPLFAALATVITGFMAADALAHAHVGLDVFSWPESVWLCVILGVASVALQLTGPGRYGLDFSQGWARRPLVSAWVSLVLAVVGLGGLWWFGAGVNPLA
ncbi:DoxX family protein [Corynebacterium sp. zg-331]|uniref:DoxX family protein n=1 Tax=unclassified Corynebacterium TaxID=2624378 RepID=UPI00128E8017|nr:MULTISPECIES: DoxX family protein [unclassified Corynebacterium]MBC3186239.1 DoxX family protein [Corynebacterium sp. zg-331]MPV52726.1 DoxX family protein [Corynebacterium sp. zg331]